MTDADYWTVEAMRRWGGGFVRALAAAALVADDDNRARIKSAWPEYWAKYEPLGAKLKAEEAGRS